ncbi:MAG: hypothetical protein IJL76_01710 [Bacilli bacterium]|nr:hypothetical protein [Bacilli bacterium]
MLILPILNKDKIFNAELTLKIASLENNATLLFEKVGESDVMVNSKKLSESKLDKNNVVEFIRFNSINYPRDFFVNTRNKQFDKKKFDEIGNRVSSENTFETYRIKPIPSRVNIYLDKLLNNLIIDMMNKVPNKDNNGRYVSLKRLGFDEFVNDEKIERLRSIISSVSDPSKLPSLFRSAGVEDLVDLVTFFDVFEAIVVPNSTIQEEDLKKMINKYEKIHSKDFKSLNNYYRIAKENSEIYAKINVVSKLIYDRPFRLVQSEKQRQKTNEKLAKIKILKEGKEDLKVA